MRKGVLALLALLVCTGGASLAADSAVPGGFPTIQAAIDDAGTVAGDTITVSGGHAEPATVLVTKAVTIAGNGIGVTTLTNPGIMFRPQVDGTTFRDFTVSGGSQAFRFELAAGTIDNTLIDRVEMVGQSSRGVEIHNATTVSSLTIQDGIFDTTVVGLRISSSGHLNGCDFLRNVVKNMNIGFYEANDGGSSTMSDILFEGNTFQNITTAFGSQGTAIFFEEGQDVMIRNNTFLDNRRDIQIFKWYQASVKVSNVKVLNNTSMGATNAVFAIFNAHHSSGQTEFDDVLFRDNTAVTAPGLVRAIYAGAHSGAGSGGVGWETVEFLCNNFSGYPTPGATVLVDFFDPGGVDGDTLGGALLDVNKNYWGTDSWPTVQGMMELPSITFFDPILDAPNVGDCPNQPLLIELESFRAVQTRGGIAIEWKTIFEIDTVGYRLIRGRVGNSVQKSSIETVVPQMIPAAGSEFYGATYKVEDEIKVGDGAVFYLLEDIDTHGNVTRHGPYFVESQTRVKPSARQTSKR